MASYQDIASQIIHKKLAPIYFLYGEEPYFIDKLTTLFLSRIIPKDEQDFNLTHYYGADVFAQDIISDGMRFPMMGERNLIVLREAQMCKDLDKLTPYLDEFPPSTTLVFCYKKSIDKRKMFFKTILSKASTFESNPIKEYQIVDTIIQLCREKHFAISPDVAEIMAEHTGTSLEQIASEVNKLTTALPRGTRAITADHIEIYIGISKEYNNFELLRAIVHHDTAKAFKIAQHFSKNESKYPVQAVLPLIFNYFSNLLAVYYLPEKNERSIANALKLRPYQVRDYIEGLRHYGIMTTFKIIHQVRMSDALSKGVGGTASSSQVLLDLLSYIFKRSS